MARLPRVGLTGIPQHVVQRGNNRQACFSTKKDYKAYLHWLQEYSVTAGVEIHAWVLMTNHVHLLCTPLQPNAVSLLMQSLGRRYVKYFNYTHDRSGTLWEGRFKSSLVQDNLYLLQVYRYIELNPVRAHMVDNPADYPWSSYRVNALGKTSKLCTPHKNFLALGDSTSNRQHNYAALFRNQILDDATSDIRYSLNKGLAFGSDEFKDEIETQCGIRVKEGVRGRPVGKK